MNIRGSLIMLVLGFILMLLYFSIFGFSYNKSARIGQYVAIAVIFYCIIDDLFR
ncbi:MAG: hypothetical protein LBB13_02175 [Rickettsiales bacterium]|jgi:hypothetical protein|nr:hypothetical protein [Rickettsiales bacterium]